MNKLETYNAYFINGICIPKLKTFWLATPTKFWLIWVFCIVSMVLAWLQCLNPDMEKSGEWFQRAGSIVVGFALMAEFSANYAINQLISEREASSNLINALGMGRSKSEIELDKTRDISTLVAIDKICQSINILFVFIGTIIWGYGDIIYYTIQKP